MSSSNMSSSANNTAVEEDVSVNKLKKAALERARQQQRCTNTSTSSSSSMPSQPTGYKQYSRTKVLRLPADGSALTIIPISTVEVKDESSDLGVECMDSYFLHIPDLRRYWSHAFKARKHQQIIVDENKIPALNGNYIIHFITDDEFPRNQTVSELIRSDIEESIRDGEIFRERLFWCGDIFVTCLGEPEYLKGGYANYKDLPKEVLQMPHFLTQYFQQAFKTKLLEQAVRELVSFKAITEEHQRKKELVLARMSPQEREQILKSPMGNSILDYKAITEGDINAMMAHWIEPHPTDPELLILKQIIKNPVDLGF